MPFGPHKHEIEWMSTWALESDEPELASQLRRKVNML